MCEKKEQPCFKCYYFQPLEFADAQCEGFFPASCNHPACFDKKRTQGDSGEIYFANIRRSDIIDLVDENNNCPYFHEFKIVAEKSFLWFKKPKKVLL